MRQRQRSSKDERDYATIPAIRAGNGSDRNNARDVEHAARARRRDARSRSDVAAKGDELAREGVSLAQAIICNGTVLATRRAVACRRG